MFVGHYAPALFARWGVPGARLGPLFLAAQGLDLAFDALVALGIERVHLLPGVRGPLALSLDWLPISHSAVSALGAGAGVAALGALRGRRAEGLALGGVVASHWLLDVLVHRPDVPVGFGPGTPRLGLSWWEPPLLGLAVELGPFVACAALAARVVPRRRALIRLAAAGCVLQVLTTFGPAPGSPLVVVAAATAAYLALAFAAHRADP